MKFLLAVWRWLPIRIQQLASLIVRPRYQVTVAAVILNARKQLLLCEHTYRRKYPWGLPGGDIKFGEDPVEAIKREVLEETGLHVQTGELLFVENSTGIRHVELVYLCTGVRGDFVPNDEVARIQYFDIAALPEFFPAQRETISRALECIGQNSL